MFISKKVLDNKGDTNKTIVQHDTNEDINSSNESVIYSR